MVNAFHGALGPRLRLVALAVASVVLVGCGSNVKLDEAAVESRGPVSTAPTQTGGVPVLAVRWQVAQAPEGSQGLRLGQSVRCSPTHSSEWFILISTVMRFALSSRGFLK